MKIALIAHDKKKPEIVEISKQYKDILAKHQLFATGTTGRLVEEAANLTVQKYLSARLGGEQQMGAQIANNDIDLMIFLRDPVSPHSYESQVNSIIHLCDMHNIPLATNLATAEVMLLALDRGDLDWRNVMK